MDSNAMSPADIMALTNNDGLGGGNWLAYIFIFALLFGGFGGGYGGNNAYATSAEMQRGFDNQNTIANQRETLAAVTAGTAQTVAATNQTFHDTLMANQNLYNEIQRDVAGLGVGQANMLANQNQCCSSTRLQIAEGNAALSAQIAQNEYNNAMRDAATNAHIDAVGQGIKDMFYEKEISDLRQQVQGLTSAMGTQGIQSQLDAIQANMVTYPRGWTYSAGPSPFCPGNSFNM